MLIYIYILLPSWSKIKTGLYCLSALTTLRSLSVVLAALFTRLLCLGDCRKIPMPLVAVVVLAKSCSVYVLVASPTVRSRSVFACCQLPPVCPSKLKLSRCLSVCASVCVCSSVCACSILTGQLTLPTICDSHQRKS